MKVVHHSDSQLVIEDQPWLLGLLLIGVYLVLLVVSFTTARAGEVTGGILTAVIGTAIMALVGYLMVRRTRFTFDRNLGQITKTVRTARGLSQDTLPLTRVERAFVAKSIDADGTTYRPELLLSDPQGALPLINYYTGASASHQTIADIINSWIGTPS